jgi:hypothetical protein
VSRPRKWDSVADRRAAQDEIRRITRAQHRTEFIAVDGEGSGKWRGHKYVLLGVGQNQIVNGGGLRYLDIFQHLYNEYSESPKAAFVGFFLNYDFTQWFKTLPENRARYLLTPEGIARRQRKKFPQLGPFPVDTDEWEFDILGMKRFKLRPKGEKHWLYVCDAGPFFQTSLMNVINPDDWTDPVVTDEEYATLLEGKSKRDTAILDTDMQRYNRLENTVLARLMCRLNEGFTTAGIRLSKDQWFGPGQAAQKWMSTTQLATTEELSELPALPRERGRLTYYGGWFEIFAHGHIPGTSWEYDINSAYPSIAASLPCLLHGRWIQGSGIPGELRGNNIRMVYATVSGSDKHLGAMLHRTQDGTIRRPSNTRGWYWQRELDSATRCKAIDTIDYLEWLEYAPCDCDFPMGGLADLYRQRLSVGKNTSAGKALKLVYNSVYGKLAQSIGNPKYGNSIYASLITSGCRSMILDAIATHPDKTNALLMVATDGVYFTAPHPGLPISKKLGEWESVSHSNLTLFKPGVYWTDDTRQRIARGASGKFKARGINAAEFSTALSAIDKHFDRWGAEFPQERDPAGDREGWYPQVTFKSGFSMVTCQQALQRNKWFLAGSVGSKELVQDADPVTKRHSGYFYNGIYWSTPYSDGGYPFESTPYDKMFGQPDPEEYGITPDGNVLDHWKELLT